MEALTEQVRANHYLMNMVIVDRGRGSRVLDIARSHGISGGTVFMGKGTVKGGWLRFLELAECEKEIVLLIANKERSDHFAEILVEELRLNKPNKGIYFSLPIGMLRGTRTVKQVLPWKEGERMEQGYQLITVIVGRGLSGAVVDAATAAGARGATIVHARGAGIHETMRVFQIAIEPEKEMVLIVAEEEHAPRICDEIAREAKIDEPGQGVLIVQPLSNVRGLVQQS